MGRPATGWRTLPSLERMRLPKPAAMIIAPRFFIQSCPAYFLRRQYMSCINFKMKQDAQKCPPTRPQAKKKPEAYRYLTRPTLSRPRPALSHRYVEGARCDE